LLTLSDLELGRTEIRPRPLAVADVVAPPLEMLRQKAEARGVELGADVAEGLPPISGDRDRVEQVLINLVDNAIKYTPAGGRIDVELIADRAGASLRVSDTGIGVPADERERLFQRFFRGSNIRSEGLPGTGLGLTISRTVIERHGGTITLSDHGDAPGTTVQIELPILASAS
jgi:signal transduction histidine kinase